MHAFVIKRYTDHDIRVNAFKLQPTTPHMKIPDYLIEIQHAVETVVTEIHGERDKLAVLSAQLKALTAATDDGYRRTEFLAMNPELDDDGLGTAIYWDTYFGVDKDRFHKSVEAEQVAQRVAVHEFSVAALSGNLLQYGKQGLSLHFGKKRESCPDGRFISGIPLHEVIWQARNQALHWEDGAFHEPTTRYFEHLAANVDAVFAQYKERSMAYEIVCLLEWKSAEDFFKDMKLFNV